MHVILAPVHAILLCIVQARNSSNFVRHPYAGALLSSARADVKIFIRRHCWRNKSSGPCTVVIPVQSTAREFHTSLPCRRTSPLDTSCTSLLGNCTHKKKTTCHLRGHAARKKKENTICALTVPAQAFKSAEHQCSSSRASATRYVLSLYLPKHSNLPNINARLREHPQHDMCSHCTCPSIQICRTSMLVFESIRNRRAESTLRRISSLQMTPMHSHSSRSSSSRHSCKEVCA